MLLTRFDAEMQRLTEPKGSLPRSRPKRWPKKKIQGFLCFSPCIFLPPACCALTLSRPLQARSEASMHINVLLWHTNL